MQPISNLPQNSHPHSGHGNSTNQTNSSVTMEDNSLDPSSQMSGILEPGDRPIVSNGYYNLDFIDWDNEYEYIFAGLEPISNQNQAFPGYNIPYGVSETTFATMIDQMQNNNEEDISNGLPTEMLDKIKKIVMQEPGKECSVCFCELHKDEEVRKLPCSHIFHDGCLMPWLQRNTTCPNCRLNLFAFFVNNPTGEYP